MFAAWSVMPSAAGRTVLRRPAFDQRAPGLLQPAGWGGAGSSSVLGQCRGSAGCDPI